MCFMFIVRKYGRHRKILDIPTTDSSAECGTLEMFYIVRRLLEKQENYQKGILAMGGHIDGILTWGNTADEAGFNLLALLARAARPTPRVTN